MTKTVAIVGSGAGGLISATVMRRRGLKVAVFEAAADVGGVWRYTKPATSTPMYQSLTSNLPKEIMAFGPDYPFDYSMNSFVSHENVLKYLTDFVEDNNLRECISFNSRVSSISKNGDSWLLYIENHKEPLLFDAVVIANGHYNRPFTPSIPGLSTFSGSQSHSIDYDTPQLFTAKRVLIIGSKSSGTDTAREISHHAQSVYVSDRSLPPETPTLTHSNNIHHLPAVSHISNSTIHFQNGTTTEIDEILWCTGYFYDFPFLSSRSPSRRVDNLYHHLFSIDDNSMAFLGLPYTVIPFPLMRLQAEWLASVWTNSVALPSLNDQKDWLKQDLESKQSDLEGYHFWGPQQWSYFRMMAREAGILSEEWEDWMTVAAEIWEHVGKSRPKVPGGADTYRRNQYRIHGPRKWSVLEESVDYNN
ncbi:hypothetical protein HDU79_004160 [Rhizoclosmatium sp. JEL0117]|nr:hypothetical protein HDU79_004160 [Rhizoclosmatium sp. JEL0117]